MNPDDLTEDELAKMAEEGTDEEKRAVARHPNTSLQTLPELAEADLAEEVDQNPLLPLHVEGGSDEALEILMQVARQTQRSDRLEELACSGFDKVRQLVSRNVNTPPGTLCLLAKDNDIDVRRGVSFNKNSLQVFLAKDHDPYVRGGVAKNENATSAILSLLAKDKNAFVRSRVAKQKHSA